MLLNHFTLHYLLLAVQILTMDDTYHILTNTYPVVICTEILFKCLSVSAKWLVDCDSKLYSIRHHIKFKDEVLRFSKNY